MKVQPPWESQMKPFRIAGNLYFIGTQQASSHMIDTGCGLILLDTAFPKNLYLILDGIYQLGFDPYDVKCILHSHGHIDHFGGTRYLTELTGAKTFIGRQDADTVQGKNNLSFTSELGMTLEEPFNPDVLLEDGDIVSLGKTKIRCVHTPGHTQGTFSFFFDIVQGDTVYHVGMHGGVGTNSMERSYLEQHELPLSLRDDFRAGLEKLRQESVDIFIGNHQDQCDTIGKFNRINAGEKDAFIDPSAWGKFLEKCAKRLDEMLAVEANENSKESTL